MAIFDKDDAVVQPVGVQVVDHHLAVAAELGGQAVGDLPEGVQHQMI